MALFFVNQSKCPICGLTIYSGEECIMTPPMISNTLDKFFILSDTTMHSRCLKNSGLEASLLFHRENTMMIHDRVKIAMENFLKNGLTLQQANNLVLSTGMLTSDDSASLYKFNYIVMALDSSADCNLLETFLVEARIYHDKGYWIPFSSYNHLDTLINKVQEFLAKNVE